jgi:hypothetical protein
MFRYVLTILSRFNLEEDSVLENVIYSRAYTSDQQMELLDNVAAIFHQVRLGSRLREYFLNVPICINYYLATWIRGGSSCNPIYWEV